MKKIKLSTAIALILLSVVTTVNATLIISYDIINQKQGNYQQMEKRLSKMYEIMTVVDNQFIGEADELAALDLAAYGYIAGMGDKWSQYLSAENYKEYKKDMQSNLVGIGINVVYDAEKQAILITNVYKNSPAELAGLQKFDYILVADGVQVSNDGYEATVDAVRGEEGTTVYVDIERDGNRQTMSMVRANIEKISVLSEIIEENIGYIQITEFDAKTDEQFILAVNELKEKDVKGFVLDVRNNPGGYLTSLVETLEVLLPEGNIISTVDKNGSKVEYKSDSEYLDMPIVVLTNENSVSAAEFFAAAIQEYEVGTIVGTKTLGKGYTQQPVELSDGSAIILSTSKYYTPKDVNLADIGVTPNIEVNLTDEQKSNYYKLTNETDPQFLKAIEEIKAKIAGIE